jgi:hypothetical protein
MKVGEQITFIKGTTTNRTVTFNATGYTFVTENTSTANTVNTGNVGVQSHLITKLALLGEAAPHARMSRF